MFFRALPLPGVFIKDELQTHLPQRGRREGIEQKCKRVKESKACKFGQKEKRRKKELGNRMDSQAGVKGCFFSVS